MPITLKFIMIYLYFFHFQVQDYLILDHYVDLDYNECFLVLSIDNQKRLQVIHEYS